MLPISQRAWARVLAAGCAWWLALVVLRTKRMAEMVGVSESEVRALGVRDLGNGLALALAPDPRPTSRCARPSTSPTPCVTGAAAPRCAR